MIAKKSKGFTIIELLVVVAIIAVLAAIVLVNVTQYIAKGKDAAIKGNLGSIRTNAAVLYDSTTPSSYATFITGGTCAAGTGGFTGPRSAIVTAGGTVSCPDATATAWCVRSTLNGGGSWCVDSTGFSGGPTGVGNCVGGATPSYVCQ